MLTAVRLQDFKNHLDTEIRLGRLTCLVGPNGCGKTSVLEAIQFVCTTLAEGATAFFRKPLYFEDFIRKGTQFASVGIEAIGGDTQDNLLEVRLKLETNKSAAGEPLLVAGPSHRVTADWQTNWDQETDLQRYYEGDSSRRWCLDARKSGANSDVSSHRWRTGDVPIEQRSLVPTAFLLSPSIPHLRAPSYSPDEIPKLSPDGATLASVVAYLITTEPERFADLVARIRAVVPAVERLRVRPARIELTEPTTITVNRKEIPYWESREVIGHELLFDLKGAPGIPARAVSEGTLLVTALLTAAVWNQGADVLLIDDLEKGLHPKAQRELATAMKSLLAAEPALQIAFSTHSPYIVDELTADQVWILVPDERRGVVARRLSDHPRAADALQVLTTGEFLSAEGEDWVRAVPDPG
jgi:predicted ATPase